MKFVFTRILFFILLLSLTWHLNSFAVSLSPQAVEKLRKEGRLEEWVRKANLARAKGVWQPSSNAYLVGYGKGIPTSVESLRAIALLVDFGDNEHIKDTSEFSSLLFSQGTFPTGSMRDYYLQNSYQQFDLNGAVYGWVRAPENYSYYVNSEFGIGGYPQNVQRLVEDAVNAADPYVDFSDFDINGDGWVDALIMVHAGPGAEEGGTNPNLIWSHKWNTSYEMNVDGVMLHEYAMQPEVMGSGELVHVGVFCHEFGHVLGLPDLYDTDYSSEGLGNWSLMASGSWANDGNTPVHFDAWCKYKLGWIEIDTVISNLSNAELPRIETIPKAFRLWANGQIGPQYFLVENRQKIGFDKHIPGSGLVIYHVEESAPGNDQEWYPGHTEYGHYKVALEQADGRFDLEKGNNRGDIKDPFPGWLGRRAFEDTTTPNSRDYYDNPTQVAVWNISDSYSVMYANLDVTWSRHNLVLQNLFFNDSTGGDGDGSPEAEETVELYLFLCNCWAALDNAYLIASADTEGISFTIDSVNFGNIGAGDTVDNYGSPLEFTVAPGFPNKKVNFTFHVCGNGGTYCTDLIRGVNIGLTEVLLVDDDDYSSGDSNYVAIYQGVLDQLDVLFDVWDKKAAPEPSFALSSYPILIWFTGNHRVSLFSSQDVQKLMDYLDGGGNLFLTSQDAAQKLSSSGEWIDSLFLVDYLHASYGGGYGHERYLAVGVPGDPVGDTLYMFFGEISAPANQISKDILLPDLDATEILKYTTSFHSLGDSVAGIKYQGDFKVVFFGFGFEGMDSSGNKFLGRYLSKPAFVMERVLNWLRGSSDVFDWGEEFTSLPKAIHLYQNYPNPFNPSTNITFTVYGSQFTVHTPIHTTLKIYNIRGELVRTLLDEVKPPGVYSVIWDGKNQKGDEVSSGIYFYQLKAKDHSEVRKMILLK